MKKFLFAVLSAVSFIFMSCTIFEAEILVTNDTEIVYNRICSLNEDGETVFDDTDITVPVTTNNEDTLCHISFEEEGSYTIYYAYFVDEEASDSKTYTWIKYPEAIKVENGDSIEIKVSDFVSTAEPVFK